MSEPSGRFTKLRSFSCSAQLSLKVESAPNGSPELGHPLLCLLMSVGWDPPPSLCCSPSAARRNQASLLMRQQQNKPVAGQRAGAGHEPQ